LGQAGAVFGLKGVAVAGLLLIGLAGCSTCDILQTVYNTGSEYCRQNPTECSAGESDRSKRGACHSQSSRSLTDAREA